MGRPYMIMVGSQNGGTGKSVVAVNFALALSQLKQKVLLVDGDNVDPSVGFYLNLSNVKAGTREVLEDRYSVEDAIIRYKGTDLYVLPGILGVPTPWKGIKTQMLASKLDRLKGYDFIVVDAATGIAPSGEDNSIIGFFDSALIVSTPTMRSIRMAFQLDEIFKRAGVHADLVLNRVTNRKDELGIEEIEQAYGARAASVLPEDAVVAKSETKQIPALILNKNAAFSKKIRSLAELYLGKKMVDKP